MRICSAFLNLHVLWGFVRFVNLHVLWGFAPRFLTCMCCEDLQRVCCQTDEDVFLICRCFFYLHVFSEVTARWALSATVYNKHHNLQSDENVMLLIYCLRCGHSNDGQNTDLGHWLVKNLISSIWVWFSEIKCKCLIMYKAKIPTLMTQCLIIGGKNHSYGVLWNFLHIKTVPWQKKRLGNTGLVYDSLQVCLTLPVKQA